MVNQPIDDAIAAYPGLRVDLNGIDDFVAALRKEVNDNLNSHVGQLKSTYEMGVGFGLGSRSPNMDAVQQVYYECLARISTLLDNYVNAEHILAAAAEQVAKQYRDTDAMAAASTDEVSKALTEQAKASPPPISVPFSGTYASPPSTVYPSSGEF